MRLLRDGLTLAALLFLGAGYAASQFFALTGRADKYASLIDIPQVRMLSLLLLLAAVALAFVRESREES
jgi:hypothetical protein